MEYTVQQLANLSGVSARTLRYYDEIDLLRPSRKEENGYRIYGAAQVNRLQQILFYRTLDVRLEEIKSLLDDPSFDREIALYCHLETLYAKRAQMDVLICNVTKTIQAWKGEIQMQDQEKFEGLKERLLEENEVAYGTEIRQKYGAQTVDASNQKLKNMAESQYARAQELTEEIATGLKTAMKLGNPSAPQAQQVCRLHKEWICLYWPTGTYSLQAHEALGEMYVEDSRFRAYYDQIQTGAAMFLRDALQVYCSQSTQG